jgi:filamentous hemagglutinin
LTTLESGGTTTIAGGQVTGKRVEVDAQDLIIQSKQDTNKANSQQFDASLQVTVGYGVSVSGSVSASKAKADYASVNEQSGIIAGDGGYNVNVKNNTNLIGGIVTSSQAAEDAGKNSFSTGTLTSTDVQNHADYSATGFGIGGGFAMNGTGANTNQMTPQNTSSAEQGKASLTANKSVGFGMDSGHDNSTTESGINTSNLTITNAAGQAATGKSVEQIKAEVATDTVTDTVALNSGHIANNYDAQAVQDEINLQVKVTQEFDKTRQGIKAEFNQAIDDLKQEQKDPKTTPERSAEIDESLKKWQTGGVLLDIVAGGLAAPTNAVGGIVAGSLAPAVSYQIGQHFKENGTEGSFNHILAHTILGAATAAAGGNNALIGGLAAGSAEAAAPAVMHYLYGKDIQVKDLTAEQKSTISAIVGLGGAAIGATGSAGDVTQGSMAAVNAVEENQQINLGQWTNGLAMGMPPIVNACAGLVPGACDAYSKELQEKAAKKITLLDVAEFALEACSVAPTPAAGACRTASLVKDVGTVAYDVYTLATEEDATFKEKSKNAQKIIIVDVFGKVLERTLERKSAAFRSLPNKYKESVIEAAKLGVDKTVSKMLGV